MNIEKRVEFWRYLKKEHPMMIAMLMMTDKRNGCVCEYLLSHINDEVVKGWDLEQMAKGFKDYMNRGTTSHTIKF
jgi:hypothetical protein